jgi:carboxymethylenebutenolidase
MGDLTTPEGRDAVIGTIMPLVMALDTAKIVADTQAYLDFLDRDPVVAVGYCMGGTNAFKAIAAFPERIRAVASFHGGRLVTDAPDSPHRLVGDARAELVFGHADQDRSMPAEAVAALGEALDAAGLAHTNEIYPGAAHGYSMADTSMYDEAATERHFSELEALFARTLRG